MTQGGSGERKRGRERQEINTPTGAAGRESGNDSGVGTDSNQTGYARRLPLLIVHHSTFYLGRVSSITSRLPVYQVIFQWNWRETVLYGTVIHHVSANHPVTAT